MESSPSASGDNEFSGLSIVGLSLELYHPNPTSPRELRLRLDRDPVYGYKRLHVTGEELAKPPRTIWKLKELEYLDMSPAGEDCDASGLHQLKRLPPDVMKLVNLRVLCLDTNQLNELPLEIGMLHNLERLVLSNNLLSDLPMSLGGLDKLRSLHLANNYLTEIPCSVFLLKDLQFLDVCDNTITHLAPEIGFLTKLESLLLMCNMLKSLPDAIGECALLKTLWLGSNELEELPRSIGALRELDWGKLTPSSSNLEGNPLKSPPLDVCKQGPQAIKEYFRKKDLMGKILDRNASSPNDASPVDPTSKDPATGETPKNYRILPSVMSNTSRAPSSTSCAADDDERKVPSMMRGISPPSRKVIKNSWTTSPPPDKDAPGQMNDNRKGTSPYAATRNKSSKMKLSSSKQTSSILPQLISSSPRESATPSQRKSFTPALSSSRLGGTTEATRRIPMIPSRKFSEPPTSSKSTPILRWAASGGGLSLSRGSWKSDGAVGDDLTDSQLLVLKRSPSRYTDYVKTKARAHISGGHVVTAKGRWNRHLFVEFIMHSYCLLHIFGRKGQNKW